MGRGLGLGFGFIGLGAGLLKAICSGFFSLGRFGLRGASSFGSLGLGLHIRLKIINRVRKCSI